MAQDEAREEGIALLAALATAQLGPLGGLAVRLGAPLALDAAARLLGRPADDPGDPAVQAAARQLLERPALAEVAAAAEERAQRR